MSSARRAQAGSARGLRTAPKQALGSARLACARVRAGYQRLDYTVGVLLKDMGKVVTASYAHNVDAATVAGAEISRRLDDKDVTTFTLGCAFWKPLRSCET